jgi:hypothetical protein
MASSYRLRQRRAGSRVALDKNLATAVLVVIGELTPSFRIDIVPISLVHMCEGRLE